MRFIMIAMGKDPTFEIDWKPLGFTNETAIEMVDIQVLEKGKRKKNGHIAVHCTVFQAGI